MLKNDQSKQVLAKLDQFLSEKGLAETTTQMDEKTKLTQFGLPALNATKAILQDIHSYRPPSGSSPLRVVKNKIINLIKNVAISTVELAMIKQNKFNELTSQFVVYLMAENERLSKEVSELKSRLTK